MAAGQVLCCALGVACTSTADDESDVVSDIRAGYAADAYFADGKNTRLMSMCMAVRSARETKAVKVNLLGSWYHCLCLM